MKLFLTFLLPAIHFVAMAQDKAPEALLGKFTDDYGIQYRISDRLWTQLPSAKFHVIRWNQEKQYLIALNDKNNPGEGGLYTGIDYMEFRDMLPYRWGFCLSSYNAISEAAAEAVEIADRKNPRKGCNGFPFSRMKPLE